MRLLFDACCADGVIVDLDHPLGSHIWDAADTQPAGEAQSLSVYVQFYLCCGLMSVVVI